MKTITGIGFLALMAITFAMNSNKSTENTTLENIIALNSAQAEDGGSIVCTSPWSPLCATIVDSNGNVSSIWGTKI